MGEKETLANSLSLARDEKAKIEKDLQGTLTELSGLKASNEEMSNANATLKASATELNDQMKGLQNQISTLNSAHDAEKVNLQSQVEEAQSAKAQLQNSVDALKKELLSL